MRHAFIALFAPLLMYATPVQAEETTSRPTMGAGVMLATAGTIDLHTRTVAPAGIVFGEADFPFSRWSAALIELGAGSAWDTAGHSRFLGAFRGGLRWTLTENNAIDTAVGMDAIYSHEVFLGGDVKYVRRFGHYVFSALGVSAGYGVMNNHVGEHELSGIRLALIAGLGTHLWER